MLDKDRPDTVTGDIFDIGVGEEGFEHPHIDLVPDEQVFDRRYSSLVRITFPLGVSGTRNFCLVSFIFCLAVKSVLRNVEIFDLISCWPVPFRYIGRYPYFFA